MSPHILILDANIIIRAVLGNKVRQLLVTFSGSVEFFTPDVCVEDAEKYLPLLFEKRAAPVAPALEVLSNLKCLLQVVDKNIYEERVTEAKQRLKNRDIRD